MAKKLKKLDINEVSLVERGANPEAKVELFKSADPVVKAEIRDETVAQIVEDLATVSEIVDAATEVMTEALPEPETEGEGEAVEESLEKSSDVVETVTIAKSEIEILKGELERFRKAEIDNAVNTQVSKSYGNAPAIAGVKELYVQLWNTPHIATLDNIGKMLASLTKGALNSAPIGESIESTVQLSEPAARFEALIAKHMDSSQGMRPVAISKALKEYPNFLKDLSATK